MGVNESDTEAQAEHTRITAVRPEPLDLPLREPFEISLGVQKEATNLRVRLETDAGVTGIGEGSPLAPVTGETREAALATARAASELLVGEPLAEYRRLITDLHTTFPGNPSALFALETAILDAYCRNREIPLSELFGGPPITVETDMTIGIMPAEEAKDRAARAADQGFDHIKIKTGSSVAEDVDRVLAVSEGAPRASLKVDANQGWTVKQCVRFADEIADAGVDLELIEQPVPAAAVQRLAEVTRRVSVPVAADEAVFDAQDALRVVRADAADIINIKLGKAGLLGTTDIIAIAKAAGLELMIGCMLESAIGTHTAAHVVAGTDAFGYVDLDANRLLAEDVIPTETGPAHEIDGPGHGIDPPGA